MKTGVIKFNVRERGRKHRGQDRNFDTAVLADVVNGPEVQERVKNRDLLGYFGHWPRLMFGLEPGEGGVYEGKQITLEPAVATTMLRANADGTIEHEAEFLDTPPGRSARRMFSSKTGGFSSVINVREFGGRDVPIGFHGFDFVKEPNFTTNRGYALDGVLVMDEAANRSTMILDAAIEDAQTTMKVLDGLYNALQQSYDDQSLVMQRLLAENAELVDLLARGGPAVEAIAQSRLARLDDAGFTRPGRELVRLDSAPLAQLANAFKTVELEGFEPIKEPATKAGRMLDALVDRLAGAAYPGAIFR